MKKLSLLTILFFSMVLTSNAQVFKALKSKISTFSNKKVLSILNKEAITSNFKDCNVDSILTVDFSNTIAFANLCDSTRLDSGYHLTPGFYEIHVKSFCLKAGTYGPSSGDGYLYAPIKGPQKEIVESIIENWANQPEIPQTKIQSLLWAIIAKVKFKHMHNELKVVAGLLLNKEQMLAFTNYGMDAIPDEVVYKAVTSLPSSVQAVMRAEQELRNAYTSGIYDYRALERAAMRTGINPNQSLIASGTWNLHPKGYYISYLPNGYTNMVIRIYVPDRLQSIYYFPSGDLAMPASNGSQRLAVSDVLFCVN